MLEKEIKYKDYNGNERTESFFFNLNQTDMNELDILTPGGLATYLDKIRKRNDQAEIYGFFKKILKKSYGVKSPDGRKFIRNDEVWDDFISTPAYDKLIQEFMEKPESIADFIEGIMPEMTPEQKREFQKEKLEVLKGIENVSD